MEYEYAGYTDDHDDDEDEDDERDDVGDTCPFLATINFGIKHENILDFEFLLLFFDLELE